MGKYFGTDGFRGEANINLTVHNNYRFIVGFNAGLIGAGVLGFIQPTTSAVLHNTSTLCIGLRSMKNLVSEEELQ